MFIFWNNGSSILNFTDEHDGPTCYAFYGTSGAVASSVNKGETFHIMWSLTMHFICISLVIKTCLHMLLTTFNKSLVQALIMIIGTSVGMQPQIRPGVTGRRDNSDSGCCSSRNSINSLVVQVRIEAKNGGWQTEVRLQESHKEGKVLQRKTKILLSLFGA